jgi:hypothetical protein
LERLFVFFLGQLLGFFGEEASPFFGGAGTGSFLSGGCYWGCTF